MFIDGFYVDKMEPFERKALKVQKGEDNEHGIKCSQEERLDGKTKTAGEAEGCVQKQVSLRACLRSDGTLPSESHPFLCEGGGRIIYQESEERCLSG